MGSKYSINSCNRKKTEGPCSECSFPLDEAQNEDYVDGDTPLMFASWNDHINCVNAWIRAGADVNETNSKDEGSLFFAAYKGHDECVKRLLYVKADVNMIGNNGRTALICSAFHGRKACMKELLAAGADVYILNTEEQTVLDMAAMCGYDDCVNMLIQAGADVNAAAPKTGNRPLIYAAMFSHFKTVDLLIKAGADVDARTAKGNTALNTCFFISEEKCEELRRSNKDENDYSFGKCVDVLIKAGADVNSQNDMGDTPLFEATWNGHYECIILLLKAGVDLNKRDQNGNNALERYILTAESCREDIALLLFAAGEKLDKVDESKLPDVLDHKDIELELKHMCKEAIRNHLIHLKPHSHLFHRIPQLGLPSPITRYLLYYMSLQNSDN